MLSLEEKTSIAQLVEAGISMAEIARRTGRSAGTVYNIKKARAKEVIYPVADPAPLKILIVKDYIDEQLKNGVVNKHKLYLNAQRLGYRGSYNLLNSYIHTQVGNRKAYKRSQRVETMPGEQAQVDWGSFGEIRVGVRQERLYAFVYVLSYSRAMYVEFVVRQNQQTLQSCHMHAFKKLGIPRNIRYDNMKTVALSRERLSDNETRDRLNPAFTDFARYYGFNIELCPRYWPRSKGKVESAIKYLRRNFVEQRKIGSLYSIDELNEQVENWVATVAQKRLHRTTEEQPYDRWQQEKRYLQFPNLPAYSTSPLLDRHSTKDGLVQYKKNLYPVSMPFAQKKLTIREVANRGVAHLEIYYKNDLIAKYKLSFNRGEWVSEEEDVIRSQIAGSHLDGVPVRKSKKIIRPTITVVPRGLNHYNNFIPKKEK